MAVLRIRIDGDLSRDEYLLAKKLGEGDVGKGVLLAVIKGVGSFEIEDLPRVHGRYF